MVHPSTLSASVADFLFVCKPTNDTCLYDSLHPALLHSCGWLRLCNDRPQIAPHRYCWVAEVPVRDDKDALASTCIKMKVRHPQQDGQLV